MRKVIAITHVSLDGVMQAPGGLEEDPRNGFAEGGWAMPFGDETLQKVINEMMASEFDMILGRFTYDIFASYWPYQSNNIADAFNKAVKYVVSNSAGPFGWERSERISGDVVGELQKLKASDGPELHVWGSSQLLQTLTAAGLIDEYRLWVVPVVLGKGKRLFENSATPFGLSLVETQKTSTGVLINTYRPAGAIPKE